MTDRLTPAAFCPPLSGKRTGTNYNIAGSRIFNAGKTAEQGPDYCYVA